MIFNIEQGIERFYRSIVNDDHFKVFEHLLRNMSNIDLNSYQFNGQSLVHLCCLHNRLDILQYLVEQNQCDLMISNQDGWLPIHIAAYLGHMDIVQYLVRSNQTMPIY